MFKRFNPREQQAQVAQIAKSANPVEAVSEISAVSSRTPRDQEDSRYAALCSAQSRIAAAYRPGTLICLDTAEVEAEDRILERAYFMADDETFTLALKEWEERRRQRLAGTLSKNRIE